MQIFKTRDDLNENHAAAQLLKHLTENQESLGLEHAELYYRFPFYRSDEGEFVSCPVLLVSPNHGVLLLGTSDATTSNTHQSLAKAYKEIDEVYGHVVARLMKNSALRSGRRELAFPLEYAVFAPFLERIPKGMEFEAALLDSLVTLEQLLQAQIADEPIPEVTLRELLSTIQGAKGLTRPSKREISPERPNSKGSMASRLEAEIANFDLQQKRAYLLEFTGPQRIRGLAGSGKTVLLALRAALLHLANPSARILYTFYTKSLYQHIQRLITRFYRQFDDKDPDWESVSILHAWGGRAAPGVYSLTCGRSRVEPMSFAEASRGSQSDPFDFACTTLLGRAKVDPYYDYVLIDEGQDYPHSFLRLCRSLAVDDRFVLAYDELQTIFQKAPPTVTEVFGVDPFGNPSLTLEQDIVLRKCYRNPRNVLVVAHAVGFGLYGERITQMLENEEQWRDIGYEVRRGPLNAGTKVRIERPLENSPLSISSDVPKKRMIRTKACQSLDDEVKYVVKSIQADLADDLRPDDILVICVDDRNAKSYLSELERSLDEQGVQAFNSHAAAFGVTDFRVEGAITLATVHKAKGNEAFVVYVVGADAPFSHPGVRDRNILFTAMTRTKGWLTLSGVGDAMGACVQEVSTALDHAPYLDFEYPSEEALRVMHRDLALGDSRLSRIEERVADLTDELEADELAVLVERLKNHRGADIKRGQRPKKTT